MLVAQNKHAILPANVCCIWLILQVPCCWRCRRHLSPRPCGIPCCVCRTRLAPAPAVLHRSLTGTEDNQGNTSASELRQIHKVF